MMHTNVRAKGNHTTVRIPSLILKAFYYRWKASGKLPGHKFDSFGRRISFLFLLKGKPSLFLQMLCNPVSIVRYFEFSFAANSLPWASVKKALDVSSPRLLFLYLMQSHPDIHFDIVNPDLRDIRETEEHLDILKLRSRSNVLAVDAMNAPFPSNSYDVVTSISVLEHIPDDEDMLVVRKLWGFLRAKGRLVITVPCAREYEEEWRAEDMYKLGNPERNGKIFFQRIYDPPALRDRIIDVIGSKPVKMEVFGEKNKGTFADYEKRWSALGLLETVKDPYHIVSDYRLFRTIEELEGIGVCGLIFEKGV